MKTIVSITPIRAEADSRTFKQAASVARFGYRSIVVEGDRSDLDTTDLPFELRSIRTRQATNLVGEHSGEGTGPRSRSRTVRARLGRVFQRLKSTRLGPQLQFVKFLAAYSYRYCCLPLLYTPKASIYYLHAPTQFPAVYLLCKWHHARFVYDAHDFYSGMKNAREMTDPLERRMTGFIRWIESVCVRKAAVVVTVSDGIAALEREAFGCSPIVLRNCHDHRLDREPSQSLRGVLGLSFETFLLVTVGQAKDGQAIREALIAMLALPESFHLAFVGRNYEQHQDVIRQMGLEGRVHLVPPVKPYEVVPFIRCADASLILYYPRSANYWNCLPNGFFQSIAAELPLLYPELLEIKSLAEQYQLGIPIDPHDPDTIRTAVLGLTSSCERIEMYKRNLHRAASELNWEQEEGRLRKLLSEMLN